MILVPAHDACQKSGFLNVMWFGTRDAAKLYFELRLEFLSEPIHPTATELATSVRYTVSTVVIALEMLGAVRNLESINALRRQMLQPLWG